jgi:hypothetical protein
MWFCQTVVDKYFFENFLGYFWARNLSTRCFVLSIENMDENRNQSSN